MVVILLIEHSHRDREVDGCKESGRLTSLTLIFNSEVLKLVSVARIVYCNVLSMNVRHPFTNASPVHVYMTVGLGSHRDLFLADFTSHRAEPRAKEQAGTELKRRGVRIKGAS